MSADAQSGPAEHDRLAAIRRRFPWLTAATLEADPEIAEAAVTRCANCGGTTHELAACPVERRRNACPTCQQAGHDARSCPQRKLPPRACATCRRPGHYARTCPLRPVETELVDLVAAPTLGEAELSPAANHKSPPDLAQCLPLVEKVARKMARRLPPGVPLDDLISAGHLGLVDAARRFDPAVGQNFEAFAEFRIRGAMLDEMRGNDSLSRDMRQLAKRIASAAARAEVLLGHKPADEEIAREMGVEVDELRAARQKLTGAVLVSADEGGEDLPSVLDRTPDERTPDAFEQLAQREGAAELVAHIERLPARTQRIMSLRYADELSFREIGEIMGVTESRICQVHTAALAQLRAGEVTPTGRRCRNCREVGHRIKQCPLLEVPAKAVPAGPARRRCSVCRESGHRSDGCEKRGPEPPPAAPDAGVDIDVAGMFSEPGAPPQARRCSKCRSTGHRIDRCPTAGFMAPTPPPPPAPVRLQILQERPAANDLAERPRTRGDCAGGMRPCPWVSCRHHNWMTITAAGNIHENHPGVWPEDMQDSCSLDVADEGGRTLEQVGAAMGVTRERTRQIEVMGLENAAIAAAQLGGMESPIDRQHTPLGAAMGNE